MTTTTTTTTTWIEEDWEAEANHPPFSITNFYDPTYQAALWPRPVDYPFFKRWTEEEWKLYQGLVEEKIKIANEVEDARQRELESLTSMINELAMDKTNKKNTINSN